MLGRGLVDLLAQAAASGAAMLGVVGSILVVGFVLQRSAASAGGSRPPGVTRHQEAVALAIGGLASLLPVLAAPAQAAPRNALYLLVAVLMASLLVALPRAAARWPMSTGIVLVMIAWLGSIAAAARIVEDRAMALARRDEQLARHAYLRAPERRGSDATIRAIASPAPRTLHAIDITSDPGELVNWCVASYYGLHSVRIAAPDAPR